jgi:hypothetical protein
MPTSSDDSGKPAASGGAPADADTSDDLPRATVVGEGRAPAEPPPAPADGLPGWVWLAGAGALLVIGWAFILYKNNFRLTAPVAFVCMGYGAGVAAVYTLFRTGASAVSGGDDDGDAAAWGRPVGARAELEREKKALLKAIKEAEFDLAMGKLSKADAEAMIASYRAQAIAVIREIDRKDNADASTREQIAREVRARLEIAKTKKGADAERRAAGKKSRKQALDKAAGKPAEPAAAAEAAAEPAAEPAAAAAEPAAEPAETDPPEKTAAAGAEEAAASAEGAAADPRSVEPRGPSQDAGAAKEATP